MFSSHLIRTDTMRLATWDEQGILIPWESAGSIGICSGGWVRVSNVTRGSSFVDHHSIAISCPSLYHYWFHKKQCHIGRSIYTAGREGRDGEGGKIK